MAGRFCAQWGGMYLSGVRIKERKEAEHEKL